MTTTDALAAIGLVAIFLGLWNIWPAVAIIAVGVVVLASAVGLALSHHRRGAGPKDTES